MDPLGHASIGLMVKPFIPKAPLWALIAACEVPDLLFFGFQAAGVEDQAATKLDFAHGLQYLSLPFIPWSHGCSMCLLWATAVATLAYLFWRDRRASIAIGLMVLSHWVLDFIVYPIMPLFFRQSSMAGIGLMTSVPGFIASIIREISLITVGVVIYYNYWKGGKAI